MTAAKRLNQTTFYLDASIYSRVLADRIKQTGAKVEHAGGVFAHNTEDEEWLTACGKRGWVVLMRDTHVRRRILELEALVAAKVAAFVFTAKQATATDTANTIERLVRKFANIAISEPKPFIRTFAIGGSLSKVKLRPPRR